MIGRMDVELDQIAVVGAGTMGAGIAEVLARAGSRVRLVDAREGAAEAVAAGLDLPGLTAAGSLDEAVADAGLVVECIVEDLDAKAGLLRTLGNLAPAAVVASNSSTFGPTELAPYAADPARLLVAHFFNPATVVPLVELVPAPQTAPEVMAAVEALLQRAGKTVVRLRRDVPGFVANRLQAALLREAIHLVETGVATIEDVDAVVTESIGVRWSLAGPFRISDLGGLDVWRAVCARLWPELSDATQPEWLARKVAAGELGAKTGTGFHDPAGPADEAYRRGLTERFAREH